MRRNLVGAAAVAAVLVAGGIGAAAQDAEPGDGPVRTPEPAGVAVGGLGTLVPVAGEPVQTCVLAVERTADASLATIVVSLTTPNGQFVGAPTTIDAKGSRYELAAPLDCFGSAAEPLK